MAIADRSHLAELLGDILTRLGPSPNAVAREYDVTQSQLSRLLRKQRARVAPQTYNEVLWLAACAAAPSDRLRRHIRKLHGLFLVDAEIAARGTNWLESREAREIRRLFLGAEAQAALAAYWDWIYRLHGTPEAQLGVTVAQRERLGEAAVRTPKVQRELDKLFRVCDQRGHDPSRLLAAFISVLEPLNCHTTTRGIERGFDELSDEELAEFVALGLKRERILLNRDNERARAQWAAGSQHRIDARAHRRMYVPGPSFFFVGWEPSGARDTKDNTCETDDA